MSIVIGISLDWEKIGGYSEYRPWYALRDNYFSVISKYGAVPIAIPHESNCIEEYINLIDGLIIPGGDYDISPFFYAEKERCDHIRIKKDNRVSFEMELIKSAMKKNIPILGICAGEQLMAVMFGGTLIQDINLECNTNIIHEQTNIKIDPHYGSHDINIEDDSHLFRAVKAKKILVNSTHHQAVKTVGDEFKIVARSNDGIIEAIEHKNYKFMLGVEWHPEYEVSEADSQIFKYFVNNCLLYSSS